MKDGLKIFIVSNIPCVIYDRNIRRNNMNNYTMVVPTWTTEIWVDLPELEYKGHSDPRGNKKIFPQ
jgi:hypothetical protein